MRIAVCDDEKRFLTALDGMISRSYNSLDIITDLFTDGRELLADFRTKGYDIVFLDIEMPGIDGLMTARELRAMSGDVQIVFLTSHVEYAIEGYEVSALRYLTKPADERKVREVIDYVLRKMAEEKLLWVRTSDGDEKVRLSDILFIEAQNKNVVIYTADRTFTVRGNISDFEDKLASERFFRIHRGYLIALSAVARYQGREVVMDNGSCLPVSRTKDKALHDALFSYISREAM